MPIGVRGDTGFEQKSARILRRTRVEARRFVRHFPNFFTMQVCSFHNQKTKGNSIKESTVQQNSVGAPTGAQGSRQTNQEAREIITQVSVTEQCIHRGGHRLVEVSASKTDSS